MNPPRLLFAGAHSGVGKTSISAGIMRALRKRGLNVQPFKVGPDYIDPSFHNFVTGRKSRNLDSWMLPEDTVRYLFKKNACRQNIDISIIEGVMGLFDGHTQSGLGSSDHIAQILKAPTILIINGASIARSIAALVHGYNSFKDFKLAGVIINMLSGAAHYDLLKNFIEKEANVPCFGYLKNKPQIALKSRHMGLVPSDEVENLDERLMALAEEIEESVDIDALIELARSAPQLEKIASIKSPQKELINQNIFFPDKLSSKYLDEDEKKPILNNYEIRLGIARDKAFSFYYEDNLDFLRACGVELVPFSPIDDIKLPDDIHALYFGSGFPEIFASQLAANKSLRQEIKERLKMSLPAYAECGGMAYLCAKLYDIDGECHEMIDFFPHTVRMDKKLQNFGYVTVNFTKNTILGPAGTSYRAHEFHHSYLEVCEDETSYVMNIGKSEKRFWQGGLAHKNVLAAYPHLHFYTNPFLIKNFLDLCLQYRDNHI